MICVRDKYRGIVDNRYNKGINYISWSLSSIPQKAIALWNDPDFIEISVKVGDETRFLVVGKILGKHWSGVITYRGEKIRIISVRRSRKEEVEIYEGS